VEARTRVVFLQHPRESRVAIGTARIAQLGLTRSELHEGISFTDNARIQELLFQPGTALLFPGEGAVAPGDLEQPPETLLVIDGTWPQARKMFALNPALQSVPRIGFVPEKPGNYRIRREPAAHCVATVEAVVEVLAAFERDRARFEPLIRAFDSMVDHQIAAKAARVEPIRCHAKPADPWWFSPAMPDLDALSSHLVVVAGEANSHRRGSGVPGLPELIHLVGFRPWSGGVFSEFLQPRRPLAPGAPHHLEVTEEEFQSGLPLDAALERWNAFLRPDDRLVGWGPFAWELLAQESWHPHLPPIDLRGVAAHRLKRRPGAPAVAAEAIGAIMPKSTNPPGRAGKTARALAVFLMQLVEEKRSGIQAPNR
jgi:DTW domain-containing protein YfiP